MTDWEPATEVEAAMRDALRAGDQELYFRILARSELLLPVSSDALAGRAQVGWGTWTTNGRTHVLAFTSGEALRVCLADNAGSARRMPYHDLAATWPNLEWWLAVNPGLPIEGYLPAWFVAQLARGDVRLPGRTMGARARLDRAESAARARARASVPGQVVQGEIIEPPFVDRAAAVTGPVLEPDSIEPPQRNRPTRPPGFDSPLASMRRRGGVPAPTDATPSSPAAPPPFRPVPTPQVTDVTPEPYRAPVLPPQVTDDTPEPYRAPVLPSRVADATPEPYRAPVLPSRVADATPEPYRAPVLPPRVTDATPEPYRAPVAPPQVSDTTPHSQRPVQRPAANGESAWPPPVVHGDQAPRPSRQPADPPREVTERPTPAMRPRSPFREDPARSSPPGRFAGPPRPPRPQVRPTSGGGFFGAPDQAEQGQPTGQPGTPARDEQRQTNWSPANGAAASVPHETRPSAGTPNGSATQPSPWPAAGRDAPGWADSTPPAPAPAWPAASASPTVPPPDAQSWTARQSGPVGPDLSGTNVQRPAGPIPPSDLGPVRRTPGQSWPEASVAGAPRPAEPPVAQPWPGRPSVPAPGGATVAGDPNWPARASGSAPAQRWAEPASDAAATSSPTSFQPVSGAPASTTPQTWDRVVPTSEAPSGAASGDPQAPSPAAGLWPERQLPATPIEPEPAVGPKPAPRATDLWPDQSRPDAEPAARVADLWSAQQPTGGPSAGTEKNRATDLWSGQRPPGEPAADAAAPAGSDKPRATDLWSGGKPADGGPQPGSDKSQATDLRPSEQRADGAPRLASDKPRATDLWSGEKLADGGLQPGSDKSQATDLWPGKRPADGGLQPGSDKSQATDLWPGEQPADDTPRLGSDKSRATDLWSGARPVDGLADATQRVDSDKPRATDLWSGEQPGGGSSDGAPRQGSEKPKATDLWSGERPTADAAQQMSLDKPRATEPGSVDAGTQAGSGGPRATDLWSEQKSPEAAKPAPRATDLWSGQQHAEGEGSDQPRATDLWTEQKAAEPAARATDLWSGQKPTAGSDATEAAAPPLGQLPSTERSGAEDAAPAEAAPRTGDLWSEQKPDEPAIAAPAKADEASAGPGSRAADLWSTGEKQAGTDESAPRVVDLWANQAAEPAKADEQPATAPAVNLWTDQKPSPAATPASDLWSDQRPAEPSPGAEPRPADPQATGSDPQPTDLWSSGTTTEAPSWSDRASAGTAENPVATPAQSWSGRASAATGVDRQWTDPATPAGDDAAQQSWTDRTPTTGTEAPSWLERPVARQEPSVFAANAGPVPADFQPANDVEESLLTAAGSGSTDTFLSTLLLARVLLPVSTESRAGAQPGSDGFAWHTETMDDEPHVVVFTSAERMAEYLDKGTETVTVKFVRLINSWPKENWSFAVNPGTPVGAKLPGAQIVALASWAAEVGLDAGEDEPVVAAQPKEEAPAPDPAPAAVDAALPTMMQKTIAPSQVDYYLERGYDRVSGFVHRVTEVSHLRTPGQLFTALGLGYAKSPFVADAAEVYVLRWPAYRPSLYRIPYGGQNENAMRAMEGWVIERSPFRGNGFAPGEGSDVIAEFKVDSARLPHGAQLWLIRADGSEKVVATLDADAPGWTRAGDQ